MRTRTRTRVLPSPVLSRLLFLLLAALCLALPGQARAAGPSVDLRVSCAASLTRPMRAVCDAFAKAHPGVDVVLNLGSQGALLHQIEMGAPADVLLTADAMTMDQAAQKKLIVEKTRRVVAENALYLFVRTDGPACPKDLSGLADPAFVHVGLGEPRTTAIGAFVEKKLEAEGLWKKLEPKMALGETIKQITQYLARGETEAGFLFATEAPALGDAARACLRVDKPGDFVYPAARLSGAADPALADAFLAFLSGPEGRAILKKQGLVLP